MPMSGPDDLSQNDLPKKFSRQAQVRVRGHLLQFVLCIPNAHKAAEERAQDRRETHLPIPKIKKFFVCFAKWARNQLSASGFGC